LLGIPSWLHQQEVRPILSSKLVVPFVTWISTAWESSLAAFPKGKSAWVGNPVRSTENPAGHRVTRTHDDLLGSKLAASNENLSAGHSVTRSREFSVRRFGLDPSLQTVLVFGGGGGALFLNRLMETIGREIVESANVIHIVGTGKMTPALEQMGGNYVAVELLTEAMSDALAAADLVVCRAGMGTISELSSRGLAAIVVPLRNSPQEDNVRVLEANDAVVVLRETSTSPQEYLEAIRGLLRDADRRTALGTNVRQTLRTDVAGTIVDRLRRVAK
jgi:UDP-N-acetylglucosamine--N-acetylmuramyl-(pentapeptide) pyrophosphoryl-undecaprenol N-acetylglucosamine transferase